MSQPPPGRAPPIHAQPPRYLDDPSDEDYAEAAREALQRGDLALGLEQLTAAIALAPLHRGHLRLLDDVLARARRPLQLLELPEEGAFYGLCAARARLLARLGRFDEATRTLFAVAAFRPETPFLAWTRDWLDQKAARRIEPGTVAAGLISLGQALAGRPVGGGAELNLEAALAVAARVQTRHREDDDLRVARARALRRLGRLDEALRCVAEGDAGSWSVAVEYAAIAAARGDRGERIRWLSRAADSRPEEPSTYCDLGDAWLEEGEIARAAEAYQRAIDLDANARWPRIGQAYAEAITRGMRRDERDHADERHDRAAARSAALADAAERLGALAQTTEERDLARAFALDLTSYGSHLRDPVDPIAGVIRAVAGGAAEGPERANFQVRVRAERALAPSARLAFDFALAQRGRAGHIEVVSPRDGIFGPLWRADGSPALEAAPRLDPITALARRPFAWAAWCAEAEQAARLEDDLRPLAAAMARPPPPPVDVDPVRWVHGHQIAAALIIAHAPVPSRRRREALVELLLGVDDWSSAAAALGLRALAGACPDETATIVERLGAFIPEDAEPLSPAALAIALAGAELATPRQPFLRLRARVRSELGEIARESKARAIATASPNGGEGLE